MFRDLVSGNGKIVTVCDNVLFFDHAAFPELNHCCGNFPEFPVRISHHGNIEDMVVLFYSRFDLIGKDIDPAGDDHLLFSSREIEKPVLIKMAPQAVIEPSLTIDYLENTVQFL